MWITFGLAALFAVVAFYLPGWIALKPLGLKQAQAFIFAPCASLCFYIVLVFACSAAGIAMTGALLFGGGCCIALAIGVIGLVVNRVARKGAKAAAVAAPPMRQAKAFLHDERHLFLYLAMGVALTAFFFVRNLDGPDSFAQLSDNIYHLSLIRSYVESGNWSPLASTIFPEDAWTAPAAFYPSLFHSMAAMIVSLLGAPVPLAQNALIAAILAVVFPASMLQFVRTVLPGRPDIWFYGAFVMLGFAAFPWMFLVFGPLHSNLFSFSLVPIGLSAFILALGEGITRSTRVKWAMLFAAGLIAMTVAQTNACFTVGVILIPYCCVRIWSVCRHAKGALRRYAPIMAFAIAVVVFWCVCYKLPPLKGVVGHTWPAFSPLSQTPINILYLAFKDSAAQPFLGVVLLVGVVYLCHLKQARWLIWSYGIFCFLYAVCALTDGPIKQFLAGFWYTDGYRLAASAVLCAIPIAAAGLCRLVRFVQYLLGAFAKSNGEGWSGRYVGAGVVLGLLVLLNYYPNYVMPGSDSVVRTGVGQATAMLNEQHSAEGGVYSPEERAFVEQVKEAIPEGELVINFPYDGSALAFAVDDLNVAFRKWDSDGLASSKAIRESLADAASGAEVQGELAALGAKYLLLLDQGEPVEENRYSYFPQEWKGLEGVADDTPGLKLLLSEGDMRLYEIVR